MSFKGIMKPHPILPVYKELHCLRCETPGELSFKETPLYHNVACHKCLYSVSISSLCDVLAVADKTIFIEKTFNFKYK
jgi:hypothetical protein